MDSLTHIVLGACAGELLAGKRLGKKALVIGAIANSLPDIDFVTSFFMPLTSDLLAHRGFTHSLLFTAIVAPLLSLASMRLFKTAGMTFGRWLLLWGSQMLTHIFLDAFNAYGTGWFEPFSHYRVSFNTMFVADPLFTLWPAIAMILLTIRKNTHTRRRAWAGTALTLSSIYLLWGVAAKQIVDSHCKKELVRNGITPEGYFSTPTPLNNLLWYVVAKADSGFYIGYRSILDSRGDMRFRYSCANASLLNAATATDDIERLKRFSQGFYTAQLVHDTLIFNDLRFGEVIGWADSTPSCVFYYYPQLPHANELVVQRGRFAKWDANALRTFVRRIRGI
ncbi:metal-dependent hydrolase [Nemorincola caseinilytica]|uniref:Metal-dependent hydrolase n=1 Tax=Nemorincola caseinilytica TaxID=2054315 RepID=A0ABP8NJR1_9BACT